MKLLRQLNMWRLEYQSTAVAVGLIVLVVVVFWMDQSDDDATFRNLRQVNHDLRVSEISADYHICTDTRAERRTFAEFLDQSARPSSAGVDFSQLRSFAELDPETKAFLEELAAVQVGGTNTVEAIAARYRERFFPLPDCERIRSDALERLPE